MDVGSTGDIKMAGTSIVYEPPLPFQPINVCTVHYNTAHFTYTYNHYVQIYTRICILTCMYPMHNISDMYMYVVIYSGHENEY